jgi:hypothetical protein
MALAGLALVCLSGCGQASNTDNRLCCALEQPPNPAPAENRAAQKSAPAFDPGDVVLNDTPECAQALQRGYGLTTKELWVVLRDPAGVCPNAGVDEARIREIVGYYSKTPACRKHTPKELLNALDTGACGGDAG